MDLLHCYSLGGNQGHFWGKCKLGVSGCAVYRYFVFFHLWRIFFGQECNDGHSYTISIYNYIQIPNPNCTQMMIQDSNKQPVDVQSLTTPLLNQSVDVWCDFQSCMFTQSGWRLPILFPVKDVFFFYMFLPFSQRINQLMQMVCTYSFDDFDVTLVSKSSRESAFYNDCRDLFFFVFFHESEPVCLGRFFFP